jgi:hypothetical protein
LDEKTETKGGDNGNYESDDSAAGSDDISLRNMKCAPDADIDAREGKTNNGEGIRPVWENLAISGVGSRAGADETEIH